MSATRGRTRPVLRAGSTDETRRARIAFVGVDPDARGGIAQFGANLVRGVEGEVDTFILSYRRLYPGFTRPGRQGPDPTPGGSGLTGLQVIVPWQPSTWRAAADALERFGPDLVVLQWWSPLFAGCVRFLAQRARRRGARVVIVCHNDRAHEGFPLGHSLTRAALSEGDVLLTLSAPVAERLRQLVPGAAVHTLHHPPNMPASDTGAAMSTWRRTLGSPDGPVVLFFGNVRKYKGLADLIAAMPLVRRKTGATLVVAGTFFEPVERFRAQARALGLRLDRDIRLLPGYVPRDQVPALFALADVVALPYRSASQSGVISQAALAGTPVVVTAVGACRRQSADRGVVVPPRDPAALAAGIVRALESPPPPPSLPDGGWDDWRDILLDEAQRPATGARATLERPWTQRTGRGARDRGAQRPPRRIATQHRGRRTAARRQTASTLRTASHQRSPRSRRRNSEKLCGTWPGCTSIRPNPRATSLERCRYGRGAPGRAAGSAAAAADRTCLRPRSRSSRPPPNPRSWDRGGGRVVVFVFALAASIAAAVVYIACDRPGRAVYGTPLAPPARAPRVRLGLARVRPARQLLAAAPALPRAAVRLDRSAVPEHVGREPACHGLLRDRVMGAYRLGVELTRDRRAGALAALAFGANPSLLYLQATPMLESAIAMSLVWVSRACCTLPPHRPLPGRRRGRALELGRGLVHMGRRRTAALRGVVVAAACRRHGLRLAQDRNVRARLRAGRGLRAGAVGAPGTSTSSTTRLYMLHYSSPVSDPLFQRTEFVQGHPGDPGFALLNFLAAAADLLGPVAMGLMAIVRARLRCSGGGSSIPAGPALLGAALIVTYLTFRGTAIGSPVWADLHGLDDPFARNHNVRYGLWLIPFVPVAVAVLAGRARLRQAAVLLALVGGMAWFLPFVHGVSTMDPPAQLPTEVRWEKRVSGLLHNALASDRDAVLLMSSINGGDRLIWESGVDASRFMTEFNGERFNQALRRPFRHASWVLLAPGSSVADRYKPSELEAMGYKVVWSSALYDRPSLRYVLLRRRQA